VLLYNSPFVSKNTVNYTSGFFRDNWRIGERLTLSYGIRVERYNAYLPAQSKPAGPYSAAADYAKTDLYDWSSWAPRIGVSYPITSDNKTVVKATYGRFNFALRASDSRTIRNFNKNDYSASRYRWNDLDSDRHLDFPGELGTFVATEGGSSTVFNPDIQQPKVDEATVHVEREISGGFSARVGYVYKRESELFQLVNTARPYAVYNIPIANVDPGPDGVARTADDGPAITYYDYDPAYAGRGFERFTYINVPGYTDRFHNIEVGLDKRLSNRWQMRGSYLATRKNMWIAGVPQTPNEEFYPKNETWETTFRVSGSYEAMWGIQTSALYEYQSGTPLARDAQFRGLPQLSTVTLRMEALGAQDLPAVKLLNLRAAKRMRFMSSQAVTLQFDLYNALNTNDETARSVRSGPTYGRITAIVPPRVARLGVTYSF
jgi:outer membrane receptor protein involved in Fe transport